MFQIINHTVPFLLEFARGRVLAKDPMVIQMRTRVSAALLEGL